MKAPKNNNRSVHRCAFVLLALLTTLPAVVGAQSDELHDSKYLRPTDAAAPMINPPKCLGLPLQEGEQFGPAACEAGTHEEFLGALRHFRDYRRLYIGYDGSRYDLAALKWTQSNFIQPQTMVEERYFFDPSSGRYTVDRYLDDVDKRYGGIDSILLWPVYTNLGIDDRNQLDMILAMPGGSAGVKAMIEQFHRRGVRVLFPMNMWDQGTRDPGKPWPDAVAELMAAIGADGINGDTQDGVPLAFSQAAERIGHPLAFQPELSPSDEALAWNVLSWWEEDDSSIWSQFLPRIYRFKWLEPRHMANISDRRNRDHTNNLQEAFFNGIGWESWENIWGFWNGITARDGEFTRRIATLERAIAAFLVSADWEPFSPMRNFGVFASRWPLNGEVVWTIVNRNEYTVDGPQLTVPFREGTRYFDLYHGNELRGERHQDGLVLSFAIEPHGVGALLATDHPPGAPIIALMAKMKAMTAQPLSHYSHEWQPLSQQMIAIAPTTASASAPRGMIEIPAGEFYFSVQGTEIEEANAIGVDVSYPWEDLPRRFHQHKLSMRRFYIDRNCVSNADFKNFMDQTHYRPKDDFNFLKDWSHDTYPLGWDDKPVTWVSLEDARAYAAWAKKRLPHEWEWQYAAQGTDGRIFPWGNDWRAEAVPAPERGRTLRGPDAGSSHPSGASALGVMDMVGNVWQWTDEYIDEHTRAAILRGGSYYQPQGSVFYFPQAYRNDQHGKYLLMSPGKDRAGTLGFRCVVDAQAAR